MKFLKKVGSFLKKTFNLGFGFIKNHSFIAVDFTQKVKYAVEGQWDNRIASLIPGNLPPKIVAALEFYAPLVADKVLIIHNILQADKQSDSVAQLVQWLKTLNKDERGDKIADFAARMSVYLADDNIDLSEGWKETQILYKDFFKKK